MKCEKPNCNTLGDYDRLFGQVSGVVCVECRLALDRDPEIRKSLYEARDADVLLRVCEQRTSDLDLQNTLKERNASAERLRDAVLAWLKTPRTDKQAIKPWVAPYTVTRNDKQIIADALLVIQKHQCAYRREGHPPPKTCDCKYGVTEESIAKPSVENRGCPELRMAAAVIEAMTPNEYEAIVTRLRDSKSKT